MACHDGATYCNSCCTDTYVSVPFNTIGGLCYQYASTGGAYIYLDYVNYVGSNERQYIQVKLNDSLKRNRRYYCEYFINIPNSLRYACNNAGMLFTDTVIYSDPNRLGFDVIPANPQIVNYGNPIQGDTLNWIRVSGIFKANGGEQYLTLGNFKYDNQTLYRQIQPTTPSNARAGYYIDDVSVIPLDSFCLKADAGRDTTIKVGDSVFIGSYTNGIDTIKWFNAAGQVINSVQPGFWVKPNANSFYIVEQTVNGCYSRDTINIIVNTLPLKFTKYDLRFTNASSPRGNERSVENTWTTANEINVSHFNIQRSINGKDFITIGKVKANNKESNKYNYIDGIRNWELGISKVYYRIEAVDFDGKKTYSQIRNVELGIRNDVSVYPNPAKDVVNIVGKDIKEVRIINCLGQLVHKEIASYLAITSNTQLLTINCKLLTKGLYIVQVIQTNGTIKNEKLVVE